jgi:hypothetical protein
MSQPNITELATQIASNTPKVNKYYQGKIIPLPSFDEKGPTKSLFGRRMPTLKQHVEPSSLTAFALAHGKATYD